MTGNTWRSLGVVPLALAGAVALGVSPAITQASAVGVKTVLAEAKLLNTESWIMGGSGTPIPPPDYLTDVSERFIDPVSPFFNGQPRFPVNATNPLFTPEGLYPDTGVKTLPLDTSLAQGVSILNSTITNQIAGGNNLVVLGYSQSATISSLEMRDLLGLPVSQQPNADQLSFVLLGDPSNPHGGLLERFDVPVGGSSPTIPSLGITFSGATPSDTPWDTAIYSGEYDGYADFPRYPINLLADLNAVLGILFVHD
ncbi:MAG: PE-PPE domain-containing protein, partial [Mycobacterium sp.]